MMKRKKYLLGAGLLCTILAASFCLSHITSVSAKRAFHALDGDGNRIGSRTWGKG